ncbi:MAG TPA: hypothetical protein VGF69_14755 [Thermoanaerobaculia bacterium]|jgi:hypothetical protein
MQTVRAVIHAALLMWLALTPAAMAATTRNNDDSCDIAQLPAATLLLPYFEVALDDFGRDANTLFTVVNVTRQPQIASVTIWTDMAYPALTFDVFLTGYDVQAISLHDVLGKGILPGGGSSAPRGSRSQNSNPNFLANAATACARMPAKLDTASLRELQRLLTAPANECQGGTHQRAVGYVTIDVTATCSSTLPADPAYFDELLFDNVLTGDYQQLYMNDNIPFTGGNALVHIRAIPEGGAAGSTAVTRLPFTFYDRYTPAGDKKRDRRQPLPNAFAVRNIQGPDLHTRMNVWRERDPSMPPCNPATRRIGYGEMIRFDERENYYGFFWVGPYPTPESHRTMLVESISFDGDPRLQEMTSGDVGGWLYANLDQPSYDVVRPTQNWVSIMMSTSSGLTATLDATPLGNGCAPEIEHSGIIAPQGADDSCDIAVLPAATLLLPYFEVSLDDGGKAANTLFTVINTTRQPQIANVTIWNDSANPVLTFDAFLTGYDVQAISLYDILANGGVPGTNNKTVTGSRSASNVTGNPNFLAGAAAACAQPVVPIDAAILAQARELLTNGTGTCALGQRHRNAIGYVTVDLVGTCGPALPTDPAYYDEIRFDNVLTGDYDQLYFASRQPFTGGNPLIHLRAVPDMPYTFYDRYTPAANKTRDRRQPLPSTFAIRYIESPNAGLETALLLWRETHADCVNTRGVVPALEVVRFDERENLFVSNLAGDVGYSWLFDVTSGAVGRVVSTDPMVPPLTSGDPGGWIYLNMHNATLGLDRASQNWASMIMIGPGGLAALQNATPLGNGCTPQTPWPATIGPAGNVNP